MAGKFETEVYLSLTANGLGTGNGGETAVYIYGFYKSENVGPAKSNLDYAPAASRQEGGS